MILPLLAEDFTYHLPEEKIALQPAPVRDASKLLVYADENIKDDTFYHLPHFLPSQSLLVMNNTRVIEARMLFQKATGGAIEIFCLEPADAISAEAALQSVETTQWMCLVRGAAKWKEGHGLLKKFVVDGQAIELKAERLSRRGDQFKVLFSWDGPFSFAQILKAAGEIPLPPYLKRPAAAVDAERYQTVIAAQPGSVAAPTAALHFTPRVFDALKEKGIEKSELTLHVGAGTFQPIKTKNIADHAMHAEAFSVSMGFLKSLLHQPFIVAVGTTALRTLESLHWLGVKCRRHGVLEKFYLDQWEAYDLQKENIGFRESIAALINALEQQKQNTLFGQTRLMIQPGYRIQTADALITNFHQPHSTLLLLVAAFIGDQWKKVYDHALQNGYRFLSYGDSSLLFRKKA